jgi:hypothetical protein
MTDDNRIDVRRLRARLLANFGRYAEHVLTPKSGLQSMMLGCSQFYADEAADAVHDNIRVSKGLLPITRKKGDPNYDVRFKYLRWDSNGDAVFSFSAHCSEEGASVYAQPSREQEDPYDEASWEGGEPSESPLALAQRLDGAIRLTWLGFPHRAWLDFPQGLGNRDEYFEETPPQFVEDPPPASLQGEETKLHAQVLAEGHGLEARQVLCDLWAQRGDPRGEFGALCFSGKRTAEVLDQAARLVLEHGRSWLGPLAKVIPCSGALFGSGPFLEKAVVHFASAKNFKALGNDPHWATVKALTFAGEHGGLTPAMKNLLEVGPLRSAQLAPLKKGTWLLRALEVVVDRQPVLKELASLRLPLERLSLRGAPSLDLRPLVHASWFEGLGQLELWLPSHTTDLASNLAAGLVLLEELAASRTVLRVGVTSPAGRTGWALQRDAKGKRSLMLVQPDERLEDGPALAKTLKVKLDEQWAPTDDWLHFGLGVHSGLE